MRYALVAVLACALAGLAIASNGAAAAPGPFSPAPGEQLEPAIVFDGVNYLVAWTDWQEPARSIVAGPPPPPPPPPPVPPPPPPPPGPPPRINVYGTRVGPEGNVLDPGGIAISNAATGRAPALGFDGTNYFAAWEDWRNAGVLDTYGARVSPAGSVLDPSGIAISSATGHQAVTALAFDGTNYLVAWEDHRSGTWDVYGGRVSPGGTAIDPNGIPISTAAGNQGSPALSFDGSNYLVAWHDDRSGPSLDLYGARVSPDGTVIDPAGISISAAAGDQLRPAVSFDGTNYLVAWEVYDGSSYDIYASRVSPGGNVLDPAGIPISTAVGRQRVPTVAFDGLNYLVAWQDQRAGNWDVYGSRVRERARFRRDSDLYGNGYSGRAGAGLRRNELPGRMG